MSNIRDKTHHAHKGRAPEHHTYTHGDVGETLNTAGQQQKEATDT